MANRNGSNLDGNTSSSHIRSGQSLGLPAAFSRSSGSQPRRGSRFTNYRGQEQRISGFQNTPSTYGYDDTLRFTDETAAQNIQRSYALTDSHLALVANSTLMPTAGEFVPRSHTAPNLARVPAQATGETRPSAFKSQDGRYSQPGQAPDHSARTGRGGFDTNQRRSHMDDAKTQDRRRHLSEAAAFLTSMSNPDPTPTQNVTRPNPGSQAPREAQREGEGPRYRGDGYGYGEQEAAGSNGYGGRNQQRYDGPSRRRNVEPYDRGHQQPQSGGNWRGPSQAPLRSAETFASSKNAQGRQGGESGSANSSPKRLPKETFRAKKVRARRRRLRRHVHDRSIRSG